MLHQAKKYLVKIYLETLKWEIVSHPPYSPDIAPSDYHLFRSMVHSLAKQHFHSSEDAKKWVHSWIALKDVFPTWNSNTARNIGKVVASDERYLQ